MANYTTVLQKPLDTVSWEDDNFIEGAVAEAQESAAAPFACLPVPTKP